MSTENTNVKDYWAKDEVTTLQRLMHSTRGDEIVVANQEERDGKSVKKYKTYIVTDENTFRQAIVTPKEVEGKRTLTLKLSGNTLNSTLLNQTIQKTPDKQVFWNRKKFLPNEIAALEQGKTIKNYENIIKEYNPKKRIADMQLSVAGFLQTVSPRSEFNYYKYKDGKVNGIDSYLCTKPYEFVKLRKKIVNTETKEREVSASLDKKFTVWDIVNTLPKDERELSPNRDINVRCRWNKYEKGEMEQLEKGESLNDSLIEERRKQYLRSNHYYVEKLNQKEQENGVKAYAECWVDKETEKLLRVKDVTLSPEKVAQYNKENRIKIAEEIPEYKQKLQEQQKVNVPQRKVGQDLGR